MKKFRMFRVFFLLFAVLFALSGCTGKTTVEQSGNEVGGQAVLGRQGNEPTPWLTERHGYDPTLYLQVWTRLSRLRRKGKKSEAKRS